MSNCPARLKDWLPLSFVLCFIAMGAGLLSGCTGASSQQGGAATSATGQSMLPDGTATYSVVTLPNGTEVMLGKQAANTQVAQHMAAIATEVALSPRPTEPQGPIYLESPIPTSTWAVGYGGWLMPENTFNPEYVSCWYGYSNDKLLSVCAGHEQFGGDTQQGVIRIRVIEPDQVAIKSEDVYETPRIAGVVHIVVADSNSVTIASEDGQHTFTFDIATRQWMPDSSGATPTLDSKQLYALHEEQTTVAMRTAFALSGIPTWTPGGVPIGPTATPWLGLYPGCPGTSAREPLMVSCWGGIYNGHIMGVSSGREGLDGDLTQGVVWVYNSDTKESQFIQTPDKVGAIQITAINGTLFTLATEGHQPVITYTFDLATRQLVRNPPLPTPSESPLP